MRCRLRDRERLRWEAGPCRAQGRPCVGEWARWAARQEGAPLDGLRGNALRQVSARAAPARGGSPVIAVLRVGMTLLEASPNPSLVAAGKAWCALDGSQTMLASAKSRLEAAGVAHRVAIMDIGETGWRTIDTPVHAFVSSLAIHHLDGPAKARLFKDLTAALAPSGVVAICDLVEAQREASLALWKRH